jgi:RNA-directed DNA polymerase
LRKIDSPKPELKKIQRKILDTILHKVPLNSHAEGYVKHKSILTNAHRHVGKDILIRMDISNFFPSITFSRVVGTFEALGYPHNVAELLGKLTSHQGRLPIGAPTSPAISNIVCRRMDKRFVRLGQDMRIQLFPICR